MLYNDSKYFGIVGEIITAQGDIASISEDAFVFSSSTNDKLVLLDYGHEASRKYLRERVDKISGALVPFIGKNSMTPDKMVNILLNSRHTRLAIKSDKCNLDSVLIDSGSFLFSQDAGDFKRKEEYTLLDTPVTHYKGYGKITRIDTLLTTHTDIESHRDRRRKIIADTISILSGLTCQILYSTRGRVMYAPMGSCTYIATEIKNRLVLIVNDPLGEGWRLVPDRTIDYTKMGEVMEFSTKLVTDSLFSEKVENNRRVNILSSDAIMTTGTGIVTTVTGDQIKHVQLTEGRISISYSSSNDTVTVNVCATDNSQSDIKSILSPSIFSWFDIKNNGIVPEYTPKDDGYEDSQLPFIRNEVSTDRKKKRSIGLPKGGT